MRDGLMMGSWGILIDSFESISLERWWLGDVTVGRELERSIVLRFSTRRWPGQYRYMGGEALVGRFLCESFGFLWLASLVRFDCRAMPTYRATVLYFTIRMKIQSRL
jgi:hypothetical protein